jgi:four helix bundle protein
VVAQDGRDIEVDGRQYVAQGSLEELRYYLILSKDLTYLHTDEELMEDVDTVGRMLHGLISSVKSQ